MTTIIIDYAQVSLPTAADPQHYVAEASDLELRPGEWPETIQIRHDPLQDFAEMTFSRSFARYTDTSYSELIAVVYTVLTNTAITLEVFND